MSQAPVLFKGDNSLQALVKKPAYAERFNQVLRDRAPQFVSSMLAIGASMPDVDPQSIVGACMQAAALDLPIDKNLGLAWIVPYREGGIRYAQCQIGWKGFVNLALRSGFYDQMNASPINKEAYKGRDKMGNAIIDWDAIDETKPPIGYAFAWKLRNANEPTIRYWSIDKVRHHAQRYSQAYRKGSDTPWKTHFDEMARKTVVKNELSAWGLLSIQFQQALAADQGVVDVEGQITYPDNRELLPDKGPQFDGPAEDDAPDPMGYSKRDDRDRDKEPVATAEQQQSPPAEEKKEPESAQPSTPPLPDDPHQAILVLMKHDEVTHEELITYLRKTKFAKDNQKLEDLAPTKHESIKKGWPQHLAVIKGSRNPIQ